MLFLAALAAGAVPTPLPAAPPAPRCAESQCTGLRAHDVLAIAARLAAANDQERARALLTSVLQDREPGNRAQARFQLARLAERQGDLPGAERWYRALLDEQPAAAGVRLELGRVLAEQKKFGAAARELRRAHAAGLPPDVAKTVERITSLLRRDAPFGGSFEVALAPDSNINRATHSNTVTAFGLPFTLDDDARARSGVGVAAAGQVFVRRPLGKHRFVVELASFGNFYERSEASELTVALSAGPQFRLGDTRLGVGPVARRTWLGGDVQSTSYGIEADSRMPLGTTSALAMTAAVLRDESRRDAAADGMSYTARIAFEKALTARLYARATADIARIDARASTLSSWSYGGGLTISRQFGAFTGYAGGEFRRLEGDASFFLFGNPRRDTLLQGTLGVIVRPLTIGGFAPVARFTHVRNSSPIELYRYRRNRLELGITRDF